MKCWNYTIETGDWKIRDFIQIKSPEPEVRDLKFNVQSHAVAGLESSPKIWAALIAKVAAAWLITKP